MSTKSTVKFVNSRGSSKSGRVRFPANSFNKSGYFLQSGPAPELKAVSTTSSMAADTNGSVALLNGLVPGVALNQRIGRSVRMVRLEANIVSSVTAGTGVDQRHRLLLVVDKQPNGAAPAVTDVLDSASTLSLLNISNVKRFRVLYDRLWVLNATGEPFSEKTFQWSIPIGHHTQFNAGTAGTVADITTGSLYFIVVGSTAAGATAGVVTSTVRCRFTDV